MAECLPSMYLTVDLIPIAGGGKGGVDKIKNSVSKDLKQETPFATPEKPDIQIKNDIK